jgi:16S rRNA (cytosine967-C5)-methyltransferase
VAPSVDDLENLTLHEPARGALPRVLAARVVFEVLERGGYVAAELDRQLLMYPEIDTRDAALATELAYGVVRTRTELARRLNEVAPRGIRDPLLNAHMLVAAYQLVVLDRVPAFAVVDVAVDQAKQIGGPKVGGFANAVLRKLSRGEKLERTQALRAGVPGWLLEEVNGLLGEEQAAALFGFDEAREEPQTTARFRGELPEWAAEGAPARHLEFVRGFRRQGDLRKHPEWDQGGFVVQEEGAALCATALGARPGERILDACAGRGQKASLLADRIGPSGELWVSDRNAGKLTQLVSEFGRLRLPRPRVHVVGRDDDALPSDFDRVLVDAPCSGTGTLRHRPEIALRLTPEDPVRLAKTSLEILHRSAHHLRPGGTMLFVVCSVLRTECEAVVEQLTELRPAPFPPSELSTLLDPGATHFRLLPGRHGTDGFFLAHFEKV